MQVSRFGNLDLHLPTLLAQTGIWGTHSLAQLSAMISAEKTKNSIMWAYVLITNNDIIAIVAQQPNSPN